VTKNRPQTWTRKRIGFVIIVALSYGAWFNYLDSITYCKTFIDNQIYIDVGKMFGNNDIYQPWNIIGHFIPGLFMLLLMPRKVELFIAGILISSAVMDSPMWGVMRLWHGLSLWHAEGMNLYAPTKNLIDWIFYYYNPFGSYQVWKDSWPSPGLPSAALIFWSIAVRLTAAGGLIWLQDRQESIGKEFSLKSILLLMRRRRM
jgi:hypothetical protein